MRRPLILLAASLLAVLPVAGVPSAQGDDTELTISHVEPNGDQVKILLSVPKGADVDLDGIGVSFDGTPADLEAAHAGDDPANQVRRTTILAIDTSDSMKNERIAAAKGAANTFLSAVPEDVYVGVVTFDREVVTALAPTLDRTAASEVINGLTLARQTRLNDGVIAAVELAGTEGLRSVLVLSDGKNTNKTPLADVEAAISEAEVKVNAVALDQAGDDLAPLRAMAAAGAGAVIPADPAALTAAFTAEAESLARQILVTAELPNAVTGDEATVAVTVPDGDATMRAQAFTVIRASVADSIDIPGPPKTDDGLQIPKEAMYGGLGAIGLGLLLLIGSLVMMATSGGAPKTAEQRIASFGTTGHRAGSPRNDAESITDQAKDAAASMLRRNRGLEARIEKRLEAAGSALKAAEWFLIHAAIVMIAALLGLMLGGGKPIPFMMAAVLGVLLPWLWLGRKRRKRLKAFGAGLADTLGLISGSLSAGMSLAQSLDTVVAEGNEPIAGEFKRVLVETRLGVPLEDALQGIAERTESADFSWVVMAIKIQREVGGNLAELLNTVAATLREREYLRRQVQTLSAEGKISAYILGGLPIAMFMYLMLVRPEYVRPLYTDPIGLGMLAGALTLLGMGAFAMTRIIKVEV